MENLSVSQVSAAPIWQETSSCQGVSFVPNQRFIERPLERLRWMAPKSSSAPAIEMASGLLHERFEGELVQLLDEFRRTSNAVTEGNGRSMLVDQLNLVKSAKRDSLRNDLMRAVAEALHFGPAHFFFA